MEFEQWAADNGLVIDGMDEKNLAGLQAMFEKSLATGVQSPEAPTHTQATAPASLQTPDSGIPTVLQIRAETAKELRRIDTITKVCAGQYPDILARAI